MFDIDMTDMGDLFGVHLIREAVLITDLHGGKLSKYALSTSPQPIWTCTGLQHPTGISTDESGNIYVTSTSAPTIYVVTPEGKKSDEVEGQYPNNHTYLGREPCYGML